MADISIALIESKGFRSEKIAEFSNERALESINKAKSLVMAFWQGENICTTAQIAEFYEVSEDVVRDNTRRHRDEFESDGLKVVRGKALKDVREIISLASDTSQVTIWNPRAALRLGMLLRDSEVAKSVRTILLDSVAIVPQQSERIKELELQLAIATQNNQANQATLAARQLDHTMLTLHGKETVLALRGMADQIVETEKPTIEIIDERHNVSFKGQTLVQIKDFVAKKYGIKFKSGAEIKRFLEKKKCGDLIAQTPRTQLCEYVPEENLNAVYKILCNDSRQLLIGE
jgi:hypothetical protein